MCVSVRARACVRDAVHEVGHVSMCASGRACVFGLSYVRVCVRASVRV